MQLERFAPAKVNLFLHVGRLGADGYHPISSLATFADIGDVIRFRLAPEMDFAIEGPFAEDLTADGANLVTRARDLVLAALPDEPRPFRLTLDKRLPIASGVGGGSSDAAATLMLLGEAYGWAWLTRDDSEAELADMAGELGADTPMCLRARPIIAEGRGEALSFPPPFPDLDVVLVNPLRPSPTGAVYRAYDDSDAAKSADPPEWPEVLESVEDVVGFLSGCRNDLEAPAISLQPAIAEVLGALRQRPETLFARMSGSGATCFAICANDRDAGDLAFSLSSFHPNWWVRAGRLAGYRA
jgi:4-diphosphocytidyl-2-C-methyl-D-erythritol kinase